VGDALHLSSARAEIPYLTETQIEWWPGGSCLVDWVSMGDRGELVFERITFDPRIMGGRACIRGMRIPVSVIVGQIAHGATFEEILQGYPDLEQEDIQQALEYAAWLTRDEVRIP